jgi:hypothetical protein
LDIFQPAMADKSDSLDKDTSVEQLQGQGAGNQKFYQASSGPVRAIHRAAPKDSTFEVESEKELFSQSFNKAATEVKIPLKSESQQLSNRSLGDEFTPSESVRKACTKQVSNISDMEFEATMGQPDLETLGKFFSNNNVSSP